jgi:hypothetical protein
MRSYWIKIAAGALGIFAVGMLAITGFRSVKGTVTRTLNSTDPIPIPVIGLVPFRLDNDKLGSISRVEFLRSDPEHVSGVRILVKLADSIRPDRLGHCQLALDDVDNIGERTTFRCEATTGPVAGLEPFGVLVIKNSPDTFPLLLPSKAVADLRSTQIKISSHGIQVNGPRDTLQDAFTAHTDSVREALEALVESRGDSVDSLKDIAGELEDSSANAPAARRRQLQRSADSVRSRMRAMLDRLKTDEARLNALEEVSGLSPAERDSLAALGGNISDSANRVAARELQRARLEIERAQREAHKKSTAAQVEAPTPTPAARPR